MTILDLILVIIIFMFVGSGWWLGFIKKIGSLVGLVLGIVVAGQYFVKIAEWILPIMRGNDNLAKVVAFVVIFVLVNAIVGVAFAIIDKLFGIFSILPFLKSINRLLGGILGLLEAVVGLGILLVFIGKFPFARFVEPWLLESSVANELSKVGDLLLPLLPEIVEKTKGLLPKIIKNEQ